MSSGVFVLANATSARRWLWLFLAISTLIGAMSLIVPLYWLALAFLFLASLIYLLLSPDKTFFLAIFTIPFTERIRVLPISFSINEVIILFALGSCLLNGLLTASRVSLRTSLDGWIVLLTLLFFGCGFFSISHTGLLGFFKIVEAFAMFYIGIYLLRTRQITRANVLKVILVTALFQASIGIFQSVTGIGSDFRSARGYLGYLGLGSNMVWHGKGTTWHFNTLGNFLVVSLLVFVPVFFRHIRRKKIALFWAGIILLGIITTYSRGTLLGLIAGLIFYLAVSQANWKRSLLMVGAFLLLVILPLGSYLSNSSYVETVSYNERLTIWQVPLAAITASSKAFWLGSGLNSYALAAWPYIPAFVPLSQYHNWFAHNFYLLTVMESGLIGAAILFSFLLYLWLNAWVQYRASSGGHKTYAILISSAMVGVFFVSIFDHTFASPHYKVFVFVLLSLLYAQDVPAKRVASFSA
jgi:O-antigen ligase